jgi:hypothetical protein
MQMRIQKFLKGGFPEVKFLFATGCVTISLEVGTTIDEYSHDLSLFSRSTGYGDWQVFVQKPAL